MGETRTDATKILVALERSREYTSAAVLLSYHGKISFFTCWGYYCRYCTARSHLRFEIAAAASNLIETSTSTQREQGTDSEHVKDKASAATQLLLLLLYYYCTSTATTASITVRERIAPESRGRKCPKKLMIFNNNYRYNNSSYSYNSCCCSASRPHDAIIGLGWSTQGICPNRNVRGLKTRV